MPERRKFLIGVLQSMGAAAAGGFAWAGLSDGKYSPPFNLRPPGAVDEEKFVAKCTKCGLCIEACPFGSLLMAEPGDGRPPGTPYFSMRHNPCRMCRDIPCAAACPTGALDISLVSEETNDGGRELAINKAKIGLAVIDRETCIAYWGIQCDACYRTCPLIDKALTVEYSRNERTGKHAFLAPAVHSDHCTGCGLCEHACITEKASIFVLPKDSVTGRSSARYIKGWESEDEERIQEAPGETTTVTPKSEKTPLDYLNREDF